MNSKGPDYILDLSSVPEKRDSTNTGNNKGLQGRPWLSIRWTCCQTYSRIYRNRRGDAYEGRCPKCGSPVKATIGAGGVENRFFEAG
ncbi:MAG: hypothetical protein AAGH99_00460 [Planctomycetota bacterium]